MHAVQKVYVHNLTVDRMEGIWVKLVQVLSRQWKGSCDGRADIFSSIPTNIFVAKISIQYLPKAEARVLDAHEDHKKISCHRRDLLPLVKSKTI